MSVLACNRNGCRNIMCDRYSPNYGYICVECYSELLKMEISANISVFMGSKKATSPVSYDDPAQARLEREFMLIDP